MYYTDYLEHHGVKGMKWGVRKDERSTNIGTKKSADQLRNSLRGSYNGQDGLAKAYSVFETLVQQKAKVKLTVLNVDAYLQNDPSINDITGDKADKFWSDVYAEVFEESVPNEDDRIRLALYSELVKRGLDKYFTVLVITEDGKRRAVFRALRGGKLFYTLNDATKYARAKYGKIGPRASERSREKYVEDTTPVKVTKRGPLSSSR